jgi:hypothetical protein
MLRFWRSLPAHREGAAGVVLRVTAHLNMIPRLFTRLATVSAADLDVVNDDGVLRRT